jgi:MFS family permease
LPVTVAAVLRVVRHDRAVGAITAVFGLNGVIVGASLARVPALRDRVHAGTGALGLALVAVGLGSLVTLPATAPLVRRFGSSRVVLAAAGLCGTAWICAGVSTSVAQLWVAMLGVGAGIGAWDVAMNVQGYAVEQRDRRSWMPWLHAAVSAGVIAGAGLGALAARLSVSPLAQFLAVSTAIVLAVSVSVRGFLSDVEASSARRATRRSLWLYPPALLLGVVVVSTALGEGAAGDWLALTLVDTKHTTQTAAAVGYAAYSAAMLVGRLAGGRFVDRWGRVTVLRIGGVGAAAGVLLVCFAAALPAALLGALLWGVGLSVVFPLSMSAAGELVADRGADGIAVVSTIGYAGFLLGPPLLGAVADVARLDRALLVVAFFAVLIVLLAGAARDRRVDLP